MTVKKKDINDGQLFGLLSEKPKNNQEHNKYLNRIKNLSKKYNKIDPHKTSVNNLNIKVKSFNNFEKTKKNNSFQPLLEELKLQLIEKIKLSLHDFINTKFIYDYTMIFPNYWINYWINLKNLKNY